MTDDRAPLTAQEIVGLREWASDEKTRAARYRLLNEPELPSEVYLRRVLRALDELEALKREMDEACRRLAFTEGQERRLRARLEAVEADTARLDFIERMGGAVLGPVDSNILPGESWVCDVSESGHPDQWDVGPGLRGAIDEAIRAQAQIEAHAALAPDSAPMDGAPADEPSPDRAEQ